MAVWRVSRSSETSLIAAWVKRLAGDRRRAHLERRDADRLRRRRSAPAGGRSASRSSGSRPCRGSSRTPASSGLRFEHRVQRLEHEAVAAERDQRLRFFQTAQSRSAGEAAFRRRPRLRCARRAGRCRARAQIDALPVLMSLGRVRVQLAAPGRPTAGEHKRMKRRRVTVPFRVAAGTCGSVAFSRALIDLACRGWETMFEWGRRASDRATSAPAAPVQDLLLEARSRTSRSRFFPAADRAEDGPDRRRRGAGALVDRADRRGAVRAGSGGRAGRAAVAAGPAQGAALRRGVGRAAQGPEGLAQPAAAGLGARRLRAVAARRDRQRRASIPSA